MLCGETQLVTKNKKKSWATLGNPTVTPTHVIFGNGTWLLIALTYPFFIVIVLNICYFVDVSSQPDGNTYEGSMRNTSRCFNFFEHGKYRYLSRLKNFRNISNFSLRHVISQPYVNATHTPDVVLHNFLNVEENKDSLSSTARDCRYFRTRPL